MSRKRNVLIAVILIPIFIVLAAAQAGRRPDTSDVAAGSLLGVVASRVNGNSQPVQANQVALYDNGVEQFIKSFSPDPSPARIVLLVDNSQTIRADVQKLEEAAREFAYEIYEGDKLLIVGYDEEAEIVADWTDDSKAIEKSLKSFRKKGEPHLFDALAAVTEQALVPLAATTPKRVIVVIGDGLDRGSKSKFDNVLANLQLHDITVYAVQAQDRTGGALRRDQPKPVQVVQKLVEGTGGLTFSIKDPQAAAKAICDELRKSRYLLSYSPSSIPFGESRSLLLLGNEGIAVRAKTAQPPVVQ
jgi:VWFA-related protein